MSLVIRLAKVGRKKEEKYRIVVKEKRSKKDSIFVDIVGYYQKTSGGETKQIDSQKIKDWLEKGAALSQGVRKIL